MTGPSKRPFGSWLSPITSDLIVSETIGLSHVTLAGDSVYWLEMRPAEGGRYVLVQADADGRTKEMTPDDFNVRTRVHEYGGGAFLVDGHTIFFSNFADQRLYCVEGKAAPVPITPAGLRFADGIMDASRGRIICVQEDHTDENREPVNSLVSIDPQGKSEPMVLAAGSDFYSSPRLSPDGRFLAWLCWNHPNMPWDGTELRLAEFNPDGSLGETELAAGGQEESIFQPEWSPAGRLYFISDRSGWWNLYRRTRRASEAVELVIGREAEFGAPQWVFGMSTYAFASEDRIICAYTEQGRWRLGAIDTKTGKLEEIETPYTEISFLKAAGGKAVFLAASPASFPAVVRLDLASKEVEVLRRSSEISLDAGYLTAPEPVEFPAAAGLTAHANYYPPKNRDYEPPPGEKPPLLVIIHGGPTGSASTSLSLSTQYWTSRGLAVLDVDYGGSTGYGREYRQRLNGQWGVVDVEDCLAAARYMVGRGLADENRLAIRGGSAGGYTVLSALTFHNLFNAGASHFGVSDLEALARDTHKFESRYLDRLIGPYPEERDLYINRSPVHFTDRLDCPVIFFQGLEDPIVPPDQAEEMFAALKEKNIPVAYVPFEGEQHGFRRAENIKRALDAELYFYSRIFAFALAEPVEPVDIVSL
ncbi:MAG: S9 family peptidase [Deltaproteobacteria bacterium]|nr:S9 family peptidase [Deltaproteobacteria bacterium]